MKRAQARTRQAAANGGASLAQLLAFWLNDPSSITHKELVILTLESLRDDIAQARTSDGKRVTDAQTIRDYLNEQIFALRKLWHIPDAAGGEEPGRHSLSAHQQCHNAVRRNS